MRLFHAPDNASVLLVIDVQTSFLPGGSLGVPDGDAIIPIINRLGPAFDNVIFTQDWHPPGHISFASSHPGRKPFDVITLPYGEQVLWPDHCVQGSEGAALADGLDTSRRQLIVHKGFHADVDSYSAFVEADKVTKTGLAGYLRERGIGKVYLVGLATDYCVGWSALDAAAAGFEVAIVEDACRGIDTDGSLQRAWSKIDSAGIARLQSSDIIR